MEVRKKKRNSAVTVAGIAVFLLILFAGFALSMPHAVGLAKEVRVWGLSELPGIHATFEEDYNAAFPMRTDFINLNGLMARALQKRELNEIYKLKNGQLIQTWEYLDVTQQVDCLQNLNQALSDNGIAFTMVMIPCKGAAYDAKEVFPAGLEDHAYENTADCVRMMQEKGIDVLDLGAEMEKVGMDMDQAYFRTDHHWRSETAFWAAGQIMEHLSERYGVEYDPTLCDLSNYRVDTYDNWLLGSSGKRTGALFAGVDDFQVMVPTVETHMTTAFPAGKMERTGTFYDVNIDPMHLLPRDWFGEIAYCTWIGGDFPDVVHTNPSAPVQKRVVMLKESFSLPLQAFLSLQFSEIDVFDPRYYEGSIVDYIQREKPEIVLVCYNIWAFREACFFDFSSAK